MSLWTLWPTLQMTVVIKICCFQRNDAVTCSSTCKICSNFIISHFYLHFAMNLLQWRGYTLPKPNAPYRMWIVSRISSRNAEAILAGFQQRLHFRASTPRDYFSFLFVPAWHYCIRSSTLFLCYWLCKKFFLFVPAWHYCIRSGTLF